jgi:hypothetical protein
LVVGLGVAYDEGIGVHSAAHLREGTLKRLIAVIALVVAGCGGGGWQWQYRSDANFNQDWYQCQRDNQHDYTDIWGDRQHGPDNPLAISCMEARGWRREPKQN